MEIGASSSDEECVNVPAARLKIGANGEIELDEESLRIEQTLPALSSDVITVDKNDFSCGKTKRKKPHIWTPQETTLFFRCLNVFGTDFSRIETYVNLWTRKEIKMKYQRELKKNPTFVYDMCDMNMDYDHFLPLKTGHEEDMPDEDMPDEDMPDEVISDKTISAEAISDKAISDKVISDKVISDKAISDEAISDEAISAEAISDKAISDKAISDKAVSDKAVSDKAVSDEAVSDEAISDEAISNEAISDKAISDKAISDKAISDKAISNEAISDKAISNEAISDKSISNEAISDKAINEKLKDGNVFISNSEDSLLKKSGNLANPKSVETEPNTTDELNSKSLEQNKDSDTAHEQVGSCTKSNDETKSDLLSKDKTFTRRRRIMYVPNINIPRKRKVCGKDRLDVPIEKSHDLEKRESVKIP